jgi:hypothetical protein
MMIGLRNSYIAALRPLINSSVILFERKTDFFPQKLKISG